MALTTVIEISERNNFIELKFEIDLEWYDYRVRYFNLKENSGLNVLNDVEKNTLWLPYIIEQEIIVLHHITVLGLVLQNPKLFVPRSKCFMVVSENQIGLFSP